MIAVTTSVAVCACAATELANMANSRAVTNKVTEFERLLLLVGRRAVVEFFKAFMFLFVLPNVSDETEQHAIFTANHEKPRFRPGLNLPGTKLFKGF